MLVFRLSTDQPIRCRKRRADLDQDIVLVVAALGIAKHTESSQACIRSAQNSFSLTAHRMWLACRTSCRIIFDTGTKTRILYSYCRYSVRLSQGVLIPLRTPREKKTPF